MKPMTQLLVGVLVALLAIVSGCHNAKTETASPPAGVVRGLVRFDGVPPKRAMIDAGRWDPAIVKTRNNKPLLDNKLIVSPDGGLADALVFVSSGLPAQNFAPPAEPTVFEIVGSEYVPHVQAVLAGGVVRFINRDKTLHNVHCDPGFNVPFNIAQPLNADTLDRVFKKPEMSISIQCDVHPWENAVLHVVKNPYFAITKPDGSFEIKGLPPGEYELTVVHAYKRIVADSSTMKVRVTDDHGATAAFTYCMTQAGR